MEEKKYKMKETRYFEEEVTTYHVSNITPVVEVQCSFDPMTGKPVDRIKVKNNTVFCYKKNKVWQYVVATSTNYNSPVSPDFWDMTINFRYCPICGEKCSVAFASDPDTLHIIHDEYDCISRGM